MTRADKILELHLGSEFYRFKETEWYRNIKNAMNEAMQLTLTDVARSASKCYTCDNCSRVRNDKPCIVCIGMHSELLLCGVCDEPTMHDTTNGKELICLVCNNVAKE